MKKGFVLDDLEVSVAPTGSSDSAAGIPCLTIILIWMFVP